MKEQQIINAYEIAKERYAKLGIDTDAVMETLQSVPMSMRCWHPFPPIKSIISALR